MISVMASRPGVSKAQLRIKFYSIRAQSSQFSGEIRLQMREELVKNFFTTQNVPRLG